MFIVTPHDPIPFCILSPFEENYSNKKVLTSLLNRMNGKGFIWTAVANGGGGGTFNRGGLRGLNRAFMVDSA